MFWNSKWVGRKSYAVVEKYFEKTMKMGENTSFKTSFPQWLCLSVL